MTEQLPIWRAPGVEPPEDLKNNGWQPGMKPSAQHINWLFNQLSILAAESGVTVEDILTSTSSVNALSAKQGKVLKDLIDTKANDRDLTLLQEKTTQHLADYEYQIPTINGTQIQLTKQSNSNRLLFKLESELNGNITVSTDAGATSKNLVDVDGVQVTSLDEGFHEVVAAANFFIIRNKGGLSKTDLEALITIVNEAEANESTLRTEYINTVNATDESIVLPSTATWNDILLQIPNIRDGNKKWAEGITSYTQVSTDNNTVIVEGLTFKPSLIIITEIGNTSTTERNYDGPGFLIYKADAWGETMTLGGRGDRAYLTSVSTNSGYVNNTGFRLKMTYFTNTALQIKWVAFE